MPALANGNGHPTGADAKALARLEAQRREIRRREGSTSRPSSPPRRRGEVLAGFGRGTTGGNTSSKLEHSASLYSQGAASRSAITGVAPSVCRDDADGARGRRRVRRRGADGRECSSAAGGAAAKGGAQRVGRAQRRPARGGGDQVERAAAAKAAKAAVAESIATRSPTASSVRARRSSRGATRRWASPTWRSCSRSRRRR